MTLLIWLAASSLAWGGVLWIAGRTLQRATHVSGATRQWVWRGATLLLLAPWIAAPFVVTFGLGLAPAETVATVAAALAADTLTVMHAADAAGVQTQVISDGGSALAWLSARSLPEMVLIAVIAGWLVRFVLAQLALRSLLGIVNVSRDAEPGLATSFVQTWAQRLRLRPAPRLRIVAEQHSPFSYGILRPTICVPEGMENKLSRGSLDLVVGHESLHIARGDGWLRPVERVTADVLWFNPFAWLIRRELDVARELAVDEAVLAMSNARVAYARTLRDVAGFAAGLSANAPAASMSLPGGRNLVLRVSRTLSQTGKKPARAAIAVACLLGLVAAPLAVAQVMVAVPARYAPPAPVGPVPPVAPVPPIDQLRLYVGPDGVVRSSFAGTVTAVSGNASTGFSISLESTDRTDEGDLCVIDASGFSELSVAKGQGIAREQTVGKHRNGIGFKVSTRCTDEVDANGHLKVGQLAAPPLAPLKPIKASMQVAPPPPPPAPDAPDAPEAIAPIAPVAPVAPVVAVAPVAPPAPPSRAGHAAPVAPPAPPAPPALAPLSRPLSAPLPGPLAAPRALPQMTPQTPMVAPTPVTPLTPMTPMTPVTPVTPVTPLTPLADAPGRGA